MILTDVIIPYWEGSSPQELNKSLNSLKKEISLINKLIIVCDGKNSFFNLKIEDQDIIEKTLIIYLKENNGAGKARNIGVIFSEAENLLFLDAGDLCIDNRISIQNKALKKNYVSIGAIREINSIGLNRLKPSFKNVKMARRILPYRNPFNNVTIGIKRKFFNEIGGYGQTRIGEDWILTGKILKKTNKIDVEEKVLVLVNIKSDFLKRRRGKKIYLEIKKSLEELHKLEIINLYELKISKIIQKITRVYFSKELLSLVYKLNRKETNN